MTEISDLISNADPGGDRIARLRDRLFLAPGDAGAMLELAGALEASGDLAGAIDLCQRALRVDPYRPDIAVRLGALWMALGDAGHAGPWFERALALDPDNAAAIAGMARLETGGGLTAAYIRTLFDQYAPRFDAELTGTLEYRAPALVAKALTEASCAEASVDILDLGCGTGLSGLALHPFARRLDGVDLSPGMIAKARDRRIYASLTIAEALAFLDAAERSWGVIGAVDVLNYMGDLAPILAAAAARLTSEGLFVGTLEERLEGGVALTEKRRYSHGADHLEAAARAGGFVIRTLSRAALRAEGGKPVPGLVFVLAKG